ncbi:TRAP-type C4-dicarboxylate transport system, small permease component [Palleronia marisminoris]|uniref:TRAP transporter small permease protein n=1 Tax=Palleronia marisminoris TaxID=315423 RepID=A0A1Y5TJL7_9RHOB|nr:TRAP transporter small permease [Palleronia marisminoris]SFH41836.1 TRAP-type C4-dicarboxylate transport system, small permease component [Palleronia marisminoris]SLN65815.1 2,3-diketo-L-gulonate TRAP transporter small permease protein YiaM [Palleronia marisminoris]
MLLVDERKTRDPAYRVLHALATVCMGIAGVQLVLLIVIFGWLVWGRYVLNDTPTWVEQLALVLVVWITFLGGATGVWTKSHLSVDFMREMMPSAIAAPLRWVALVGVLLFSIALAIYGTELTMNTWARTIPMLGFAEGWRAMPMAICGVLSALFTLYHMAEHARGRDPLKG